MYLAEKIKKISQSGKKFTATELAKKFHVTRQAIYFALQPLLKSKRLKVVGQRHDSVKGPSATVYRDR